MSETITHRILHFLLPILIMTAFVLLDAVFLWITR